MTVSTQRSQLRINSKLTYADSTAESVGGDIKSAADKAGDWIGTAAENAGTGIKDAAEAAKTIAANAGDKVKDVAETAGDKVKDVANDVKNSIAGDSAASPRAVLPTAFAGAAGLAVGVAALLF